MAGGRERRSRGVGEGDPLRLCSGLVLRSVSMSAGDEVSEAVNEEAEDREGVRGWEERKVGARGVASSAEEVGERGCSQVVWACI